jgi:hypothetical protein
MSKRSPKHIYILAAHTNESVVICGVYNKLKKAKSDAAEMATLDKLSWTHALDSWSTYSPCIGVYMMTIDEMILNQSSLGAEYALKRAAHVADQERKSRELFSFSRLPEAYDWLKTAGDELRNREETPK